MTKKHFIAIAAEFKTQLESCKSVDSFNRHTVATGASLSTIGKFCDAAIKFNPNFDRARFFKACGV